MTHGIEYLQNYSNLVNPVINKIIDNRLDEAKLIGNVVFDSIERFKCVAQGGKRLRGALVKLSYELAGGTNENSILMAGASLELLHAGLLVHDDIMDNGETRRGVQTVHSFFETRRNKSYGINMGINAGDFAYFLAWHTFLQTDFDPTIIKRALDMYSDYAIRIVDGQILDISENLTQEYNVDEIMNIHRYKTADYTGVLPLQLGYILSGEGNEKRQQALKEFGLCFGWVFQIQDDILGLFGEEAQTGKPVTSDVAEGKKTIPIILALEDSTDKQKQVISDMLGNPNVTTQDIKQLRSVLIECGAFEKTHKLMEKYIAQGNNLLPEITQDIKYVQLLQDLLTYMRDRVK